MFYKKHIKSLGSLLIFVALCSFSQHTYSKVIPKYPGCHNFGKLAVPLDFIAYLEETRLDDPGLMEARDSFRSPHGNYQNT